MTSIDFYFQVDDKHDLVRKLCAKAMATRARLVVWATDSAACKEVSRVLWSVPSTGFVPHVSAADPLAAVTPVIVDCGAGPFPHDEILVNLRAEVPPFFSRFQRLLEIVSAHDEQERSEARARFRHYKDRGYELRTHDMSRHGAATP